MRLFKQSITQSLMACIFSFRPNNSGNTVMPIEYTRYCSFCVGHVYIGPPITGFREITEVFNMSKICSMEFKSGECREPIEYMKSTRIFEFCVTRSRWLGWLLLIEETITNGKYGDYKDGQYKDVCNKIAVCHTCQNSNFTWKLQLNTPTPLQSMAISCQSGSIVSCDLLHAKCRPSAQT